MKKNFIFIFPFVCACACMSSCYNESKTDKCENACDSDTIVCDTTDYYFGDDEMMVEICPD